MSTRITNLTSGPASLPSPYRGIIAPGRGAIVSDSPPVVAEHFGGAVVIEGLFRLDWVTEPGQPQFNPAPTHNLIFANEAARDAYSAKEGDSAIVGDIHQHYSNGEWHNADGSST